MDELSGLTVIVTGGGRGIGLAVARACARAGAGVVLAARTRSELEGAAALIERETGRRASGVACDVADAAQVKALFAEADRLAESGAPFGRLYGVVCAAGILGPVGPFEDLPLEAWERTLAVNVGGTVRCAREAVARMKAQGGGRIILFSGAGQGPFPRASAYAASKGAIWRLTETLAAEVAPHAIFVNAIAPGPVATRLIDDMLAPGPEGLGAELYRRFDEVKRGGGVPAEKAAGLALYLLSERSRGLTGKLLSAVWDDVASIQDPEAVSRSDLYTVRRVVLPDGRTR